MRPKMKNYKLGDPATYAHVKYDGHYCRVVRDHWGKVTHWSKNDKPLDLRFMSPTWCQLPIETNVLGELWVPGAPASYVKSAIVNGDPQLRFTVFAIEGIDCIAASSLWCIKHGLDFACYYGPLSSRGSHWLGLLDVDNLPAIQYEGFVMKDSAWSNWRKFKPMRTIDLIVHDVVEGQGKFLGLVGALVCKTAEGRIVANVSGFTYEERVYLSEADIGRVVEVKYQYVGSQGKLRHPTFVRFRDDKLPEECTLDQDEDLNDQSV